MTTRWFVDDDIAEKATSTSYRILETEVEVVPENVPAACTDENVNILSIKEELHSENSIGCDSSLQWFHLRCIYSKEPPPTLRAESGFVESVIYNVCSLITGHR